MDLLSLQNYVHWVGKTPDEILREVKKYGGWRTVFRKNFWPWAHKIRNYFNVEPTTLTRLDERTARGYLQTINGNLGQMQRFKYLKELKTHPILKHLPEVKLMPDPPPGTPNLNPLDDIAEDYALSGDVYRDEKGTIWYQMSPGGTIYHFKDPKNPTLEAMDQTLLGQARTPVFKLIAPDRTGGSSETIIKNEFDQSMAPNGLAVRFGSWSIGAVNSPTPVSKLIENIQENIKDREWFQGSYNYAETVVAGFADHKEFDVAPHERYHSRGVYVNPLNRYSRLSDRKLPPTDNNRKVLAAQVGWLDLWGGTRG